MSDKLVLRKRDLVLISLAKVLFPHKFEHPFSRMQMEWVGHFFDCRVCIEAPPYFGKTKIMSFLKGIFSALGLIDFLGVCDCEKIYPEGKRIDVEFLERSVKEFYKNSFRGRKIFMGSETAELAEDNLGDIKEEIESNQLLRASFGELIGRKTWTNDHIELANGSEIMSKGRGYQWRGFHPDDAILDDIQTDENATLEQFTKDWRWFNRQILSRRPKNLHIIGNRLTDYSIVARITDNFKGRYGDWVAKKYKALDEEGRTTWASGVPQADIEQLQRNMGPTMFAQEYLGQTSADQDIDALRSRLQFYTHLPKDTHFRVIAAFDPAFTADPYKISSSTGRAILHIAQRGAFAGRAFVTKIDRQKLLVDGVAEWMIATQKENYLSFLGLEDTVSSKGLKALFLEKCRNLRLPITPAIVDLPATRSKQARLADVMPLIENGSVLFDASDPSQKAFIEEELLPRGIGQNDRLDAFVHALSIMKDTLRGGQFTSYYDDQTDAFGDPIRKSQRFSAYTGRPL